MSPDKTISKVNEQLKEKLNTKMETLLIMKQTTLKRFQIVLLVDDNVLKKVLF